MTETFATRSFRTGTRAVLGTFLFTKLRGADRSRAASTRV